MLFAVFHFAAASLMLDVAGCRFSCCRLRQPLFASYADWPLPDYFTPAFDIFTPLMPCHAGDFQIFTPATLSPPRYFFRQAFAFHYGSRHFRAVSKAAAAEIDRHAFHFRISADTAAAIAIGATACQMARYDTLFFVFRFTLIAAYATPPRI